VGKRERERLRFEARTRREPALAGSSARHTVCKAQSHHMHGRPNGVVGETNMTEQQSTTNAHRVSDTARQVVNDSASVIQTAKDAARDRMKKPTTTAAITGAAVMGAVMIFGVLETAVGGAAAWVTYRLLEKERQNERQRERQKERTGQMAGAAAAS